MALTGAHAHGATPLSDEDLQGLRIPSVKTHAELNEVEAANIIRGQEWAVHPFRNGNGRHARMVAHIVLVRHFNRDPLPWGNSALHAPDAVRQAYIDALVAADGHNVGPLLAFARSGA